MKNQTFLFLFLFSFLLSFSKFEIKETPFTEYKFNADECKLIQHHQSRIFIQPYTFYLDGKVYNGVVNLKYREFVDQLDIILNKIPMNYAENDKHHILESAGMFELLAYGNGKLLTYAPNKKIQVQLASKFDIVGGETFTLNRNNNTWNKETPFGTLKEANQKTTDNKQDLWSDNLWFDSEWNNQVADTNGNIWTVYSEYSTQVNYEELRNESFKTMNADRMVMYNCDRIINEETVPIIADFKLQGLNKSVNSTIFVVYKNRNAVITYYPAQFATDFKLLPNEDFTIFTFSQDGKLAVLDSKFLNNFNVKLYANKKVEFPMTVFAKTPKTKAELAQLTGL